MDHPNIVKFYEVYEDKKSIHLVMEHCSGGDLYERLIHVDQFDEFQVNY
jgi:calcium-dependent protein kinase